MARKLQVIIAGDASSLDRALNRSTKSVQRFSVGMGTIFKSAVGFAAVTAGFDALGSAIRAGVGEFSDAAKIAAQTTAELKSTGGAANVTARQVAVLAGSISNLSGIDDEAVQAGENMILTFKNVRNEVGKGNAIFDRATKAAVDLSVAGFGSITDTAKQLGKALNDPVLGLTALGRSGVTFTDAQKKAIKAMVESGHLLKAQKTLLAEVESQVGGSAKALGETLPGKLNIAKERLKDLAGELVGTVTPAFTRVVGSIADFAKKLAAAQGARAKFKVVFEGVESIGRDLFNQIVSAIRQVDFAKALQDVQDGLLRGIDRIGQAINRVDWGKVGKAIGDGISSSLAGLVAFLQSVDWGQVGRQIVDGIANFLKSVNWKAVAVGTIKLLVAALKGTASLLASAGLELGEQVVRAIGQGVEALGREIEKKAIQIVLRVLKVLDFKVFGRSVIPGIDSLVKSLEARLDDLAAHAEKTGDRVQKALEKAAGSVNRSAAIPTQKPKTRSTASADQSTVDDAAKAAKAAADKQEAAAEAAAKRAADIAEKQRAAFDDLLDAISLRFDIASSKGRLGDAIKAAKDEQAAILKQIQVEGKTPELLRKLFDARQSEIDARKQLADQARERASAKQFKALGLGPTGEELVSSASALRKQLGSITSAVHGTFLDTGKTSSLLARIRKVLVGGFGTVGKEVRQKIKEMLDGINNQLRDNASAGGELTKTTSLNTKKIIEGLGLPASQAKEIRARLSGFNSAGLAVSPRTASNAAAAASRPTTTTIVTNVELDGQKVGRSVTKHQEKRSRRNPPQKRGPQIHNN